MHGIASDSAMTIMKLNSMDQDHSAAPLSTFDTSTPPRGSLLLGLVVAAIIIIVPVTLFLVLKVYKELRIVFKNSTASKSNPESENKATTEIMVKEQEFLSEIC